MRSVPYAKAVAVDVEWHRGADTRLRHGRAVTGGRRRPLDRRGRQAIIRRHALGDARETRVGVGTGTVGEPVLAIGCAIVLQQQLLEQPRLEVPATAAPRRQHLAHRLSAVGSLILDREAIAGCARVARERKAHAEDAASVLICQ